MRLASTRLRICVGLLVVFSLGLAVNATVAPPARATEAPAITEPQPLSTQPAYPDGSETIIGTPEAGPKPQHSGDRGGWAQLLTLAMMIVAVAFIAWRIRTSSRRGRASLT